MQAPWDSFHCVYRVSLRSHSHSEGQLLDKGLSGLRSHSHSEEGQPLDKGLSSWSQSVKSLCTGRENGCSSIEDLCHMRNETLNAQIAIINALKNVCCSHVLSYEQ